MRKETKNTTTIVEKAPTKKSLLPFLVSTVDKRYLEMNVAEGIFFFFFGGGSTVKKKIHILNGSDYQVVFLHTEIIKMEKYIIFDFVFVCRSRDFSR